MRGDSKETHDPTASPAPVVWGLRSDRRILVQIRNQETGHNVLDGLLT